MTRLKQKLIELISATDDLRVLLEIQRILEKDDSRSTYELSLDQKSAIEEAISQIERGQFKTNEEADQEVREWLKNR